MLQLLKTAKLVLVKLTAQLFLRNKRSSHIPGSIQKILVYGYMGIGNMVMFTPFLKALRAHYPQASITLLVGDSACESVVDEGAVVDKIITMDRSFFKRIRTISALRKEHFDLLISSFHGSVFYYVTMLMNIPHRLGHVSGPDWRNRYDFLYNHKVAMAENQHEINRGLRLAKALGIEAPDKQPEFYLSENYQPFVDDFFRHNHLQTNDLLIAVQADTWRAQQWKRWSPQKLARVCDLLKEKWDAKIIIFGAPGHREELNEFLGYLQNRPVIALGKTTLKQAAALLQKCTLAICNDSGLMHISAALGVPTVAIYGPTDFHRTSHLRYGANHALVRKEIACAPCFRMNGDEHVLACRDRICLDTITIEDVFLQCEKTLLEIKWNKTNKSDAPTEGKCVAAF